MCKVKLFLVFITTLVFTSLNYALIASPANLLTNPGAETGIVPWTTFGGGPALQASSVQSKSGNYSFFITGRTQFYHGPNYDIKSLVTTGQLVSGHRYTFSVWVRHEEATSKSLFLNIKKVDGSGTKYITLEDEVVPPNTWVKIESHHILDISGTLTSLNLYVVTSNGTTYSFYSDDFFVGEPEDYSPPVSSTTTDFIRAQNKTLVVEATDTPIVMKGINVALPTDASDTPEDIWGVKSVSYEDFQNIASMGFNSIRLTMNYKIFEDDANPGVFKEDGWTWLDRAIMFAQNAGLKILLDMHAPQGGYQSDKAIGFAAFWGSSATDPNTANQNRLIDLWGAIADRYKHETAILGYDLINEPRPHNSEEWYSYAEQLIAEIRTVDVNHLIVLEVPFIPNYTIRTVADNNVMYDSHYYYTWGYATQYSAAYGNTGQYWGKYDPENPIWVNSSEDVVPAGTANASPFDKSYLENILVEDILEFAYNNNVPVDVGEYGICWENFGEDVGAIRYLYDLDEIFNGDNSKSMTINHFYFTYQSTTFGLYTNWNGFQTNENQVSDNLKSYFENDFRWTGTSGTSWETNTNWNVGIKPGPTNNVTVDATSNNPHIANSPSNPAICNNLTILAGSNLTVDAGKALTVNGTIVNAAGSIILESDVSGTGSLLHSTPNVPVIVERYIGGYGTGSAHGWHFLGAPVADQDISAFHTPGIGDDFYKWDEPTQTWINRTAEGFGLNPDFETKFVVGRGYLVANQNTSVFSFEGISNVDDVDIGGLTNTGGSHTGWHLLSNPFSSAIKFNLGSWNKVNVGGYAQVWDEAAASYKIISQNQIIPSMNGFMVYTSGNGSLTIPADARIHSDSAWYKSDEAENQIVLTALDYEGATAQEVIICFDKNATEDFDLNYDSYYLAGFAPQFYSQSHNHKLALNCLPEITEGLTIPLGFLKNESNDFEIVLTHSNLHELIFLFDKKTGIESNLSENSYNFSSEVNDNPDRFLLKFGAVGMSETEHAAQINAWVYENMLYVQNDKEEIKADIFDIAGHLMNTTYLSGGGLQTWKLDLPNGLYIVRLFDGVNSLTLKVVMK